jgi:hypothetical protein
VRQPPGRLAVALGAVVLVIAVLVSGLGGSGQRPLPLPGIGKPARAGDPFGYIPARSAEFEARAIAGNDNVLFVKSPGGVVATARRVAAYRSLIDAAAAGTGIDPNLLEAIVFLESAGYPNAIAGADPAAAAGLTQIVAQTGQSLLGMQINLAKSRRLTAAIDSAYAQGETALVARLQAERAGIDARFNPSKALAGTIRYLELAERHFGRLDLAVESYHMGIGNLQQVLDDYDGGKAVPYVQLFFDTAPDHHASAYTLLHSFNDDSLLYYWRLLGAEQIMRLYRGDLPALERLVSLQTGLGSGAEVLHPPASTPVFSQPADLRAAYASRAVLPLPSDPGALGLSYSPAMGALAGRLGQPARTYEGLRAPALDVLIELGARVRALSGGSAPLTVQSTVTDKRYQALLGAGAVPLAAAGYSFAIERRYVSGAQANTFQAMLDLLQSLNLIVWVRTPMTIEITVASDAGRVIVDGP